MTRNEVIEARDILENVAGHFYSKNGEDNQAIENVVDMLNNIIGCDNCSNLGWEFQLPVDGNMVIRCKNCGKFDTELEARTAAYKALEPAYDKLCNELLKK